MNANNFSQSVIKLFTTKLFVISGTEITLLSAVIFLLIIALSVFFSSLSQRGLKKALTPKFSKREGTLAAFLRLIHYSIVIIGFAVALQFVGINLASLFAAGAVFAIAIGFAMQNIVQNFVSGVILLLERSIKPGDILEVEGKVVKIVDMGIRTTVVRTWRDEELIMPNSTLSQSTVKNYTLRDNDFRLGVTVGVSYDSDMEKVIAVLEKTVKDIPWRLAEPEPRVLLQEFGNSSVNFGVYLNVDEPWRQRVFMSELRKVIWFAFKEANITIAYPQLDVHLDKSVSEAICNIHK